MRLLPLFLQVENLPVMYSSLRESITLKKEKEGDYDEKEEVYVQGNGACFWNFTFTLTL